MILRYLRQKEADEKVLRTSLAITEEGLEKKYNGKALSTHQCG